MIRMSIEELNKEINRLQLEQYELEDEIRTLTVEEQILIFQRDLLDAKTERLHKKRSVILAQISDLLEKLEELEGK
jgi:FtsZ-binding cell division protein ZapB